MTNKNRNLLEIHLAVLLFGLSGLFGKMISMHPVIIVLGRVVFASIFLGISFMYFKTTIKLQRLNDYIFLGFLGLLLAVHWVSFFQSIQLSTVAVGVLTFSTFPVFVTFLEPIFFKEMIRIKDIFMAVVVLIGVALVIPSFDSVSNITRGALWGIGSGFTFAVLSILNRKYVKKYSSLVVAFYQDSVAALILIPFLFTEVQVFHIKDILLLVLLGTVFTAIAHTLFIKGLTSLKARTASIISCLEPVYGIIFALLLLGETPSLRVMVGGVVILGASFYATVSAGK
jgi:drug/metabolite transporter (DMT)-like permease